MSVLFLLAAGVFPSQILGLYTKDMSIVNTGTVYFRIVALSYIPMAVSNILSSWLRCKEYATIPFLASFGAVIVNTGLNYLLIFGKFGFPCMEIKGAAIATLISQLFNLVFIVIGFVLCIKKDGDKPVLSLHFKKITIRDYLIMIMPILISKFLWSLGQNVESAVYGHLGTSNLAAYTLTSPIQGLIVGALSGLSAAAGVMIGKRLGRKEYNEAYTESKKIMYAGLFGGVTVSALLILLAGAYTGLYRVDDSVKELGKTLLIVFALYAPVKVENMILGGGIIRSGGNTKTIMIIDIIGTWCIGIPLCLLAAYVFKWGIVGVYTLLTTEELFRLAVSLIIFKRRNWIVSLLSSSVLGFLLFLPYGKLTVFLCLFLFTALGFTFQLTLLMLEFQRLLCLCANAFILQLTLNFTLHSFGIEFSLYGYFSLDWGTEFQLMPILQQKLIDLIVFGF